MKTAKYRHSLALVLCAAVLSGCLDSLHPLYHEEDTVFRQDFVGSWFSLFADQSAMYVKIEPIEERAYRITEFGGDAGDKAYQAHLIELGGYLFLDFQLQLEEGSPIRFDVLPLHQITRIRFEEDGIVAEELDKGWLREYLQQHPEALAHAMIEGSLLITADTDELQRFIIAHCDDWPVRHEQTWQRGTFPRDRTE